MQRDPIRYRAGDVNLFRYVSNTPVIGTDAYGLLADDFKGPGKWPLDKVIEDPSMLGYLPPEVKEMLSQGCVGVMRARFDCDPKEYPWTNPRCVTKCFATLQEALDYRDTLEYPPKGNAKILAVQFGFWADKPGPKRGEIDLRKCRPDLRHQNWCTLHEPKGKDPFWEWADHGIRNRPDPGFVHHAPNCQSLMLQ